MNFANPKFLLLCGLALLVEAILTPGINPVTSIVAGGLIGWNIHRLQKGDS